MKTTNKLSCNAIVDVLAARGVRDIVISPGSRNAPLILAAKSEPRLRCHVVIDERSAAFVGLGIAIETQRPVALVCTSGSAVLNYGPALSEAFYRHVPLIAVTADRPSEWIDQDDSQTIRQNGIFENIVKASFELDTDNGTVAQRRFFERTVNDALNTAVELPQGPVHINVRLDQPLECITERDSQFKAIPFVRSFQETIPVFDSAIIDRLQDKKILIVAGFGSPDSELNEAVSRFAVKTGAAVMFEAQSNLNPCCPSVPNIDVTLSSLTQEQLSELTPDIVISFGGSLVSRMLKTYLRGCDRLEHWHIGPSQRLIDCFLHLTRQFDCCSSALFKKLNDIIGDTTTRDYGLKWAQASQKASLRASEMARTSEWSDLKAMSMIIAAIPGHWHLQLSNGTAVRYAQLFDYKHIARIDCNRGVSGIDGCTSTAVGAHIYYNDVTLLVTGDMSAAYDIGALGLRQITPRFKIAVLNNGGGGIFRFVSSTSSLDCLEECFVAKPNFPLHKLAETYGYSYYEVDCENNFEQNFKAFAAESERPAILNIITPGPTSGEILKEFFKNLR